jgi:hypothetical protein
MHTHIRIRRKVKAVMQAVQPCIVASSLLAFIATLSVWLNGSLPGTHLALVFIPIYVVEAVQLMQTLVDCRLSTFRELQAQLGEAFPYTSFVEYVAVMSFLQVGCLVKYGSHFLFVKLHISVYACTHHANVPVHTRVRAQSK